MTASSARSPDCRPSQALPPALSPPQAYRTEADLAKHCRDLGVTLDALMAAGAAPAAGYAAGQQQRQAAAAAGGGWKPPPPPGAPPPAQGGRGGGYGRHGQVMVPR